MARAITEDGGKVAFLTGADAACLLAELGPCHENSNIAAQHADIVFVPRLDLGAAAFAAKGRAEALLYTEFKLSEKTPFWEVWVRQERN